MSWDEPSAVQFIAEEKRCLWCDGTGAYACTMWHDATWCSQGEHRWDGRAARHRCEMCGGTGLKR